MPNMDFKLWSETSREAKEALRPNLGFRTFDDLKLEERKNMWHHLEGFFFLLEKEYDKYRPDSDENGWYYPILEPFADEKRNYITGAIYLLVESYKSQNFAPSYIRKKTIFNALKDFYEIFTKQSNHVVLETLSFYCRSLFHYRQKRFLDRLNNEDDNAYNKRRNKEVQVTFKEFASRLNEVFEDFRLNTYLSPKGFLPKQDQKITNRIIEPALDALSDDKWAEVNILLGDAFLEFNKNAALGYSNCVTNIVSAIQAFLQLLVNGKTGSGDISKLIPEAQKKGLIPNDSFTSEVFKKIETVLARERQETGVAHPKQEYATEKNAKMVINLAMLFFQHCLVD